MSWSGVFKYVLCWCYFALIIVYTVRAQSTICPRLDPPWQGQIVGSCGQTVGSECRFACRSGYILSGSSSRICMSNGRWSGQVAACEQGDPNGNQGTTFCPSLNPPVGGALDGICNPGQVGQVCHFTCRSGVLVGQPTLVCLPSGAWNNNPPICQGTIVGSGQCPNLTPPQGGRLLGNCGAAVTGDTCQLICVSGYRPSDTRILICQQNGAWSNTLPQCIRDSTAQCPSILNTAGSQTSGTCNPGIPGATCTVTCLPGYYLTGSASVLCRTDGTWSGTVPTCRRLDSMGCPELIPPENGDFSECDNRSGGRCVVVCDRGYTLVGSRVRTCLRDGRWSGMGPVCTRRKVYGYKVVPLWTFLLG